jgi:hypothetical protein
VLEKSAYEGLHNLYSYPSIIRMIKSKSMGLAGNLTLTGKKMSAYRALTGKHERKRPLEKT